MPFGDKCQFEDMGACIAANQDKDDPGAYCATLMRETEENCKALAQAEQKLYLKMPQRKTTFQTKVVRAETKVVDLQSGRIHAGGECINKPGTPAVHCRKSKRF